MSKNVTVEFDSGKFSLLPRDVPIELNFINTAIFVKNKKYALRHDLKLPDQDITVSGGKVRITKNNYELVKGYAQKNSNKEPKIGDLVQLSVPSGLDQIIFFIILKLMNDIKNENKLPRLPQTIVITYADIIRTAQNVGKKINTGALRLSIYKLAAAVVHYTQESLVTNSDSSITKVSNEGQFSFIQFQEIKTEHFRGKNDYNLFHDETSNDVMTDTFDDMGQYNKSEFVNYVNRLHKNTEYVLKIKLNDFTYHNLIHDISLWYSLDHILAVDFIEQAVLLYVTANMGKYIDKNSNIEEHEVDNICKSHVYPFVDCIPLAKDSKSIGDSVERILESLKILKEKKFIKGFSSTHEKFVYETIFFVEFYPEQVNRNNNSLTNAFDLIKADDDAILSTLEDVKSILAGSSLHLTKAETLFVPTLRSCKELDIDYSIVENSESNKIISQDISQNNKACIVLDDDKIVFDLYEKINKKYMNMTISRSVKDTIEEKYLECKDIYSNFEYNGEIHKLSKSNGAIFIDCINSFIQSSSAEKVKTVSGLIVWYLKNQILSDIEKEIVREKNIITLQIESNLEKLRKVEEEKKIQLEKEQNNKKNLIEYNSFISSHESIKYTNSELYERMLSIVNKSNLKLDEKLSFEHCAILMCVYKTMNVSLDCVWEHFKNIFSAPEFYFIKKLIMEGRAR